MSDPLRDFKDAIIVRNIVAKKRQSEDAPEDPKAKKKLLMSIYKRMPIGNKDLTGGKHRIMFSGPSAKSYGVDNFTTVILEELSMADLERAAKAVGV